MPSTSTSAPPRHRLGRLTLIVVIAVAAAGALLINHHSRKSDVHDWLGVQMNGTTNQRLPIFAVERRGALGRST